MNGQSTHVKWLAMVLMFCSFTSYGAQLETQLFFGQMYSSDLLSSDQATDISVDNANNFGIALSWNDSPNGQGQIMLNRVSHDFTSPEDNENHSLDIIYVHFNGVALFRQQNYITSVSLGLGGAYFDTDEKESMYPSATIAIGTRYEFSDNLAFITELRGYASIVDNDDDMFCRGDVCNAVFEDSLWMESNISIGLAFKF